MSHVWRPVFVVLAVVAGILAARFFIVPPDFGTWETGYMYGWHKKSDENFWKDAFKVKHQGNDYCANCHPDKTTSLASAKHSILLCENCHGPAFEHPSEPPKLPAPRGREMCLRCHVKLPYPTSLRAEIPGFLDPEEHNPGMDCNMCHNPHSPNVTGPGKTKEVFRKAKYGSE